MIDRPLLAKRLQKAYDYLRSRGVVHTVTEFAKMVGKSQGDISTALAAKGRVMTMGLLERVADAFPDYINRDYLLTGVGSIEVADKSLRPHVQARASAGVIVGISKGEYAGEMREVVQGIPDYDFTINTEGKSMMPRIEDGDDLCCRILYDRLNPPIGKICVVSTKDGNAVKVIQDATEDAITLHSLNPRYKDYTVDINDIIQTAQVVGLVRSFV